ncbi:MAG: response regulator [Bacteroidetes bacterium]|nr:response regulator [Bacteroidota bacterium]
MENIESEKPKIVYAEDDEGIARLVEFKLMNKGFDVILLKSGHNVVETIIDKKPILILLDLMLPIKDGITILKELKMNEELKNIPVIMLSVQGEEKIVVQALNLGAADYMQKPFSTTELASRIDKALA